VRRTDPDLSRHQLGQRAEKLAERLLRKDGLIVLARNWRGGGGELDRVVLDRDMIVFVEVKARRVLRAEWPAVRHAQTLRIRRAAQAFRSHYGVERNAFRFDVVTVEWQDGREPNVRWIRSRPTGGRSGTAARSNRRGVHAQPESDSSRAATPRE